MTLKRVPLTDCLTEKALQIVESRRERGAIATLSGVINEVLADCLPHYLRQEEAISRGELFCHQHQSQPKPLAAPTPTANKASTPTPDNPEIDKKSSKRGQQNAFLVS